jgi:ABC-type nitrate/sulfonate/bicarbonate transport system substrate-binding protein
MSHTTARLLRTLTLASALALMATACSSGGSTATDTSDRGGDSSTVTINFGDQQQEFETLLTDSGVLKGADYKVNFVEFDSGPLVDAGFAAHRIDLGSMGDLPASLAVKSGLPVTAIAVSLPIGASEFLLARPGVTAISQLRGKPVAFTTGTADRRSRSAPCIRPGSPRRTYSRSTSPCRSLARRLSPAPPTRRWSAWSRRSTTSRPTPTR